MFTAISVPTSHDHEQVRRQRVCNLQAELQHYFNVAFSVASTTSEAVAEYELAETLIEILQDVETTQQPQVVEADSHFHVVLPFRLDHDCQLLTFASLERPGDWTAFALRQVTEAVTAKFKAERSVDSLSQEVEGLSSNLNSTYEEISLLYAVTRNLKISRSDRDLGELALEWLEECLEASSLVIQYVETDSTSPTQNHGEDRRMITRGETLLSSREFEGLTGYLELTADSKPFVANAGMTDTSEWPFPKVRELIVVPLSDGEHIFGWLAAINHADEDEFGTGEASLLSSVAKILGIHSGNLDLYRQQNELLANIVRALTSAIDAKDPYTCGHSDRVARVSVRLAQELGCTQDFTDTIYLAGLLHDVGKIGINDGVLRKSGKLTDEEFDHIKLHPGLGHKILADLKQLSDILPAVLHHHEQWNGCGYPAGLAGEHIPFIARIVAVADSWDAMTSDRPYRNGMPNEKVEAIFKNGSGDQWDSSVIDAYFRAREDIYEIRESYDEFTTTSGERWT